jgi:hypothetical protein
LVEKNETLLSFGPNPSMARRTYLDFTRSCAEARWVRAGVHSLPWWATVDDNEETVQPRLGGEYFDYQGQPVSVVERPVLPIDTIVTQARKNLGVELSRLVGRHKRGAVALARILITALVVERHGHWVKDLALFLRKNPGSVSRWLAQLKRIKTTKISAQSRSA